MHHWVWPKNPNKRNQKARLAVKDGLENTIGDNGTQAGPRLRNQSLELGLVLELELVPGAQGATRNQEGYGEQPTGPSIPISVHQAISVAEWVGA